METWVGNTHQKAKLIHSQIAQYMQQLSRPEVAQGLLKKGITPEQVLQTWYDQLNDLYTNEYPIAKLKDSSDLLIRAIGVNADHSKPMMRTVAKLADDMRKNLNMLTRSISPIMQTISHQQTNKVPWVFNGYAPGSIMMGFSIDKQACSHSICQEEDTLFYEQLSITAQNIAFVPSFIDEEYLNLAIAQTISDPAIRDTVLVAAHNLSPSSQSGLHTIEVGSRTGGYGELTHKSRLILAKEIKQPHLLKKQRGSFTGLLDNADLGKERAILRDIDSSEVSSIRCLIPANLSNQVKKAFGGVVTITGEYEADKNGKPRLFNVHSLKASHNKQLNLTD